MSNMDVHFSSNSDEWCTPQWLFNELDDEFEFTWDLACTWDNCKCEDGYYLDKGEDALEYPWNEIEGSLWCNPPYSRGLQKKFIQKAAEERLKGATSVFLIPARTDTKAWHDYIWNKENHRPREGIEVRFLKGRLKFEIDGNPLLDKNGKPQSAPFPSCIIIFKGK